jgi:hypothetical protein
MACSFGLLYLLMSSVWSSGCEWYKNNFINLFIETYTRTFNKLWQLEKTECANLHHQFNKENVNSTSYFLSFIFEGCILLRLLLQSFGGALNRNSIFRMFVITITHIKTLKNYFLSTCILLNPEERGNNFL